MSKTLLATCQQGYYREKGDSMSIGSSYDNKLVFVSSPTLENGKGNINNVRRFFNYVLNCGADLLAPQLFFAFNNAYEGVLSLDNL